MVTMISVVTTVTVITLTTMVATVIMVTILGAAQTNRTTPGHQTYVKIKKLKTYSVGGTDAVRVPIR